ncbi:MAG: hypothetical protein ACE5HQ_06250 [Gemmatimonadota bacterium]
MKAPIIGVIAFGLSLSAAPLLAQEAEQGPPEVRYLTVTTFNIPAGEARQKVFQWINRVVVPQARVNPNVLSFRVATHNWGANSAEVALISEYPDWASIEGDCEACSEWFQQNVPEKGTPEREEFDEISRAYFKHYNGHKDEIYAINMNMAKIGQP